MKTSIIIIGLVMFCPILFSQIKYSGTVYELLENKKEAIAGANVYWLGTTTGTTTNSSGLFEILPFNGVNQLIVSFVGYQPDTINVNDTNLNIEILLSRNRQLAEVAVVSRKSGTHLSRTNPITTVTITSAELCKAACCSLAESFETNASVDVSYTDAATGAKQIQLLGLSGTYVQMLTENKANSRGLASAYSLDFVPGPWMESIQISKGASSVANGYESLTGQINLQFKKPSTSERLFLNGFASSSGRFEANANTGFPIGKKWNSALLAHSSSDSRKNDHNGDGFLDEPLTVRHSILSRWEFKPNDNWITQFGIKVLEEERTGGQMNFNRDISPFNQQVYGIAIDSKNLEAFFKTGYIFSDDNNKSIAIVTNYTFQDQKSVYGRRLYDAQQNYFTGNLIFMSHFGDPLKHKYTTGVSYLFDNLDEKISGDRVIAPNGSRQEFVPGVWFQYTYDFGTKFTLISGIRADFHNIYGAFLTPRLHMKYNLSDHTSVRASAGKGYRTPNVLAEYNPILATSRLINVADDIKQEEGWNYGLNVTQYFHLGTREVTLNIEYYHTSFQNQLIFDLDSDTRSALFYNLDGKSFSNVLQIESSMEIFRGMDVVAAWRLNDVKTTTNGILQRKLLQSRYKGMLNLSYSTPLNKWQFDFTTQLNGPGRIPSTSSNPSVYQRPERFDSYLVHIGQITKFFKSWNVYAGVENIGNFTQSHPVIDPSNPFGDYFDSSLVWGPLMGRKFYFGFRFSIDRKDK